MIIDFQYKSEEEVKEMEDCDMFDNSGWISKFSQRLNESFDPCILNTIDFGILKIEVIDSGIGISDENKRKLFKPFAQAEKDTSK